MPWNLNGNSGTDPANDYLGTRDNQPLAVRTNGSERLRITTDGKIGVGTTQPRVRVEIDQGGTNDTALMVSSSGPGWGSGIQFQNRPAAGTAKTYGIYAGFGQLHFADVDSAVDRLIIDSSGRIDVVTGGLSVSGLISSRKTLAPSAWPSGGAPPRLAAEDAMLLFYRYSDVNWAGIGVHTGGDVWIRTGTGAQKVVVLTESGSLSVPGDVQLTGADHAEDFDVADNETSEPGTVMVFEHSGAIRMSGRPYDRRVAGVVSGAGGCKPAVILDRRQNMESPRRPLALIGKVYCKVDAEPCSIEVGDLLTTAAVPGHAMKATDATRSFGAILGKALAPLQGDRGLIPVLVALQ
jgi:hypothetical protein